MTGARIVCVGDVVNDIVVVPVTAVRPDTDTTARIRRAAGGSAANSAAWLGALGAPVDFVGSVGLADAAQHADRLAAHGVVPHLGIADGLETATIVIVVDGDGRAMLTDRGANAALDQGQVTDELLDAAGWLHVTGYSLFDGPRAPGIRRLIERAHERGITVSMNPGSVGYIADYGVERFAADTAGVDVLLANLDEAALLTATDDPSAATSALAVRHGTAVVTRGSLPVLAAEGGSAVLEVPVPAATLVDPTGAGDAMAAGFLAARLGGAGLAAAVGSGIATAARAIGIVGGRPPAAR
ncbi:PfkB family carbohydrate kinase [Pseudolysinimonas kribbensis]|uniref:Sugar kinase n=1 Tax=Pseudolysinimonas kribbensis TaxID=433641 RepID=A0ABQ6K7X2_9MICO|nr:PfkB family carbohydrate kinase [Pseudolysinimonas kribbensis]GMA94836.1 sugar kinase [Pseudolysinimonas kribbensis]